ncbi:MAG: ABC transporter ATP-binding protein [Planctomycetota bacterium]
MLTLDGVRKSFGTITAVDRLSLRVEPGEVLGLLGPNGAGKTTAIGLATGMLDPDEGSVDIAGRGSPSQREVRAHLGLATQSITVFDRLTARENLVFFAKIQGSNGRDAASRADAMLRHVGLSDRAGSRVEGFSGGMKRRLNFAAAIIHDPPLVLLDEPTAGVDPHSRNAIFDLVQTLKNEGKAVVYTTHYMEEAQRLCDRVAIIDRGRLLAEGTPDGLIGHHGGRAVVTIERSAGNERVETDDPLGVVSSLELAGPGDGHDVLGLRIDRPDLESVFLSLTGRRLRDD